MLTSKACHYTTLGEPRHGRLCSAILCSTTRSVAHKTDFIAARGRSDCEQQKSVLSSSCKPLTTHAASERRPSHCRETAPAVGGHLDFLGAPAERSAARAPPATASGKAHTAPPCRALLSAAQSSRSQKPFRAKRPTRKAGGSRPCGSTVPTEGAGPANNPLPSAPQLRSSPAARDHRPPAAALRAAPGPFTAGELEPPTAERIPGPARPYLHPAHVSTPREKAALPPALATYTQQFSREQHRPRTA